MRKVGEVTFVDAHRTNKNEGFVPQLCSSAFKKQHAILKANSKLTFILSFRVVEFASHSDMKNAISKLDGTDLNGRKLKLFEDRRRR